MTISYHHCLPYAHEFCIIFVFREGIVDSLGEAVGVTSKPLLNNEIFDFT